MTKDVLRNFSDELQNVKAELQKVIDLAMVRVAKPTETPKSTATSKFNPNDTPPPKSATSKLRINLSETRNSFMKREDRPPLASG